MNPSPTRRILAAMFLAALFAAPAPAQWNPPNPVRDATRDANGVLLQMRSGVLRLDICTAGIVRVRYSPSHALSPVPDLLVQKSSWAPLEWTMRSSDSMVTITTSRLHLQVDRKTGSITFADSSGKKLFTDNDRTMTPVIVNGESTYAAEVFSNLWGSPEAFYGLGSHQAGVWNYRGESVDLSQDNTNISIPLVLSSNGYGIFWNTTSRSRFNNRFLNALYLSAEVADQIDYYFLYGPDFDTVIAGCRTLTGNVPLFGKWAYGFWQCKNRYASQEELLGVAHKYRQMHIPVDGIVQDWFWWYTMGEPVFDASRYPAPQNMVEELHGLNFHFMISFWPYFRPGTKTYAEMDRRGFFVDKTKLAGFHPAGQALYDAFNPEARAYYWGLLDTALFRIGVDAWWLDTTEPETEGRSTNILVTNNVATGNGARYVNMYPLLAATAVHDGQRSASDAKRVFILSRSAYAGSQRKGVAVWSGDINGDWVSFRRQIPAGLNYALSGLPYWTTDIGGFVSGNPDDPGYRELFVRWFQYGTFCPIFRVHGTRSTNQNELWSYGPEAQKILVDFTRLRYRLLPYIYSLAWKTTGQAGTPMRPLVMDFPGDVQAANTGDQFMFGGAFLVNPVTDPGTTTRRLYLPRANWFDFWTGVLVRGGRIIDVASPLERLPLFVRAGSIVPMGPELEWATQHPADPIELRVYRGADGAFTLYEDENDGYNYEKGAYATVPMHWDEARQVLTIGDRAGSFPGMPQSRSFRVVFVGKQHGVGGAITPDPDKVVRYEGRAVEVRAGT